MFIPFVYTSYKNSKLASVVSFIGTITMVAGIAMGIGAVADGEEDIAEILIACAVIIAIGWLITRGAKRISVKKQEKIRRSVNSSGAAAGEIHYTASEKTASGNIGSASSVCSHCGTSLSPTDVFCYKCGTKRRQ